MRISKNLKRGLFIVIQGLAIALLSPGNVSAQPIIAGLGDDIGEGVQGGDAVWQTQAFSYLNLVNFMVGGDLSTPYISSGLFGMCLQ